MRNTGKSIANVGIVPKVSIYLTKPNKNKTNTETSQNQNQPNSYLENKKKMVKKRKSPNFPKPSARLDLLSFSTRLERHKFAAASFRNYKIKNDVDFLPHNSRFEKFTP